MDLQIRSKVGPSSAWLYFSLLTPNCFKQPPNPLNRLQQVGLGEENFWESLSLGFHGVLNEIRSNVDLSQTKLQISKFCGKLGTFVFFACQHRLPVEMIQETWDISLKSQYF